MSAKKSNWQKVWARMARGGDGGSILMEFVLVAPIYLLLFGGIFWIGELAISQHYRLNSTRSTAWGFGERHHRPSSGAQVSALLQNRNVNNWNLDTTFENAVQQGRYLGRFWKQRENELNWLQVVGGTFNVNYKPSAWTRGWFNSGRVIQGEAIGADDGMNQRLEGTLYEHTVVMRTLGGAEKNSIRRRWTPQGAQHLGDKGLDAVVGAEWRRVAVPLSGGDKGGESFPYDNEELTLASGREDTFPYTAPKNADYKRFKLLYHWGNHRGDINLLKVALDAELDIVYGLADAIEVIGDLF